MKKAERRTVVILGVLFALLVGDKFGIVPISCSEYVPMNKSGYIAAMENDHYSHIDLCRSSNLVVGIIWSSTLKPWLSGSPQGWA